MSIVATGHSSDMTAIRVRVRVRIRVRARLRVRPFLRHHGELYGACQIVKVVTLPGPFTVVHPAEGEREDGFHVVELFVAKPLVSGVKEVAARLSENKHLIHRVAMSRCQVSTLHSRYIMTAHHSIHAVPNRGSGNRAVP